MESPSSVSNLREWAPLTDLLNKIPSKPNLNIFSEEVKITCLDVLPEFIALGTNYGMAYWYDRKTKDLKRLRCENSNVPITSIKVLSTVDFMLACGSTLGNVSIFQIPKAHPDWIPEKLKPKNKNVERYTVSELHKSAITALEWSKNGMKLFSGDKEGTVVLTEVDFYMHICKSLEILNETYEVVQLSYSNPKLVVSTTYRSIICEQADKWNVMQVGRQDRKILGPFGGIIQHNKLKPKDAVIYCTRPGLRLWLSDDQGAVQKTLVFKEVLKKDCEEVPLLNPVCKHFQTKSPKDVNFGVILPFGENFFVTYNSDLVYVLDLVNMTVAAKISQVRRVLDVSCHKDEIFILEEERSIIRISLRPEINYDESNLYSEEGLFLASSIKGLTSKLQPSSILSVLPPVTGQTLININEHTDEELIMNAEEALESPRKEEPQTRFENIEVDDSTEILFKHKKMKKKKHEKTAKVETKDNVNDSMDKGVITQPTLMTMSMVGQLPDLRSPQTILSSIEQKEKLLEVFLNYNRKAGENDLPKSSTVKVNESKKVVEEKYIPQKKGNGEIRENRKQSLTEEHITHSNVARIPEAEGTKNKNPAEFHSNQTCNIENKERQSPVINEKITDKDKNRYEIDKEEIGQTSKNKQTKRNGKQSVIKEKISDRSINKFDLGGLIDIDKILTLQESRTSEFKENLKTTFSNGKVMKKSQTSVMNDNVSFFDVEEKKMKSDFEISISDYTASSKSRRKDGLGASKAIPIMSKSTEMPACVGVPNGWLVPSPERKNSHSDPLLNDWVIL